MLKRPARKKTILSFTDKMLTILRMNKIKSRPRPWIGGFSTTWISSPHGSAEIFEPPLVKVARASIGSKDTNVLRRQVQNLAKVCLLFADSLLRNFAFLDVYTRAVPFDDLSELVSQWLFVVHKPAILSVSPTHARLGKERFS